MFPGKDRSQFSDMLWNVRNEKQPEVPGISAGEPQGLREARDLAKEPDNVDDRCDGTAAQQQTSPKGAGSGTTDNKTYSERLRPAFDGRPTARVLFGTVGPQQEALDIFLTKAEQQVRKTLYAS